MPGKPDIVLTKFNIVIFCDGDFFHVRDWDKLAEKLKKSNNSDYWIHKILSNQARDAEINKKLRFEGWIVIRFWESDIKKKTDECVQVIEEAIFDQVEMEAMDVEWE